MKTPLSSGDRLYLVLVAVTLALAVLLVACSDRNVGTRYGPGMRLGELRALLRDVPDSYWVAVEAPNGIKSLHVEVEPRVYWVNQKLLMTVFRIADDTGRGAP